MPGLFQTFSSTQSRKIIRGANRKTNFYSRTGIDAVTGRVVLPLTHIIYFSILAPIESIFSALKES
jgi:hypothetical protein